MLIALWIINVIIALSFLMLGSMKMVRSRDSLLKFGMAWIEDFPMAAVRLIGLAEILGAVGVVAPPSQSTATCRFWRPSRPRP